MFAHSESSTVASAARSQSTPPNSPPEGLCAGEQGVANTELSSGSTADSSSAINGKGESNSLPASSGFEPIRPVDHAVLELLRREQGLSVHQLIERLDVTATAVRQRLERLVEHKLIERRKHSIGRGRPSYCYFLSSRGWRELGATYADLAQALWSEIAELADESVRKEMLKRVSQRIGQQYASELIADSSSPEESVTDRMSGLVSVLADRKIPSRVDQSGELPVLEVQACPYPDMAIGESDRSVCELETDMLTKALGQEMELSQCRLDGHNCCQFRPTDEGKTK